MSNGNPGPPKQWAAGAEPPYDGTPYGRQDGNWVGVAPPVAANPVMSFSDGTNTVTLSMNTSGDLVASQSAGPNAGKSVNLTFGKWA